MQSPSRISRSGNGAACQLSPESERRLNAAKKLLDEKVAQLMHEAGWGCLEVKLTFEKGQIKRVAVNEVKTL